MKSKYALTLLIALSLTPSLATAGEESNEVHVSESHSKKIMSVLSKNEGVTESRSEFTWTILVEPLKCRFDPKSREADCELGKQSDRLRGHDAKRLWSYLSRSLPIDPTSEPGYNMMSAASLRCYAFFESETHYLCYISVLPPSDPVRPSGVSVGN